jgi:hypothetical protein
MKRVGWVLCLVLWDLALVSPRSTASATVMEEATFEELAAEADVVLLGRVERTNVRMVLGPEGMEPTTFTTVRVARWLKGSDAERIVIRELGGAFQGGARRIDGVPEYRAGEEILVFLIRHPESPNEYRTLGMVQGKFTVTRGLGTTPDTLRRDLGGIGFARFGRNGMRVEHPATDPTYDLEEFTAFLSHVLAELGRGGAR